MTLDQVKEKLAAITGARLVRAEQAIAAGLAIITVPATSKRAVVVGSKSGNGSYTVTGTGCTCKGWQSRAWCAHSDAVYLMLAARAEQKARAQDGTAAPTATIATLPFFACGVCGADVTPERDRRHPDQAWLTCSCGNVGVIGWTLVEQEARAAQLGRDVEAVYGREVA